MNHNTQPREIMAPWPGFEPGSCHKAYFLCDVQRATAAYTIPALRKFLTVTGLYYQGCLVGPEAPFAIMKNID